MEGHFGPFGHSGVAVTFPADSETGQALAQDQPDLLVPLPLSQLDHGALVPLWFLAEAGLEVPLTVIGLPWEPDPDTNRQLGRDLRRVMDGLVGPWALLASGDMSHALQPGAPGGFHPEAHRFDAEVEACVREARLTEISRIPAHLRDLAREDVVDSLEVLDGALGASFITPRVLAYEAPFGVGYMEAIFQ